MSFTEEETAFLDSQHLARLATVAPDGQPDAVPVGFEFDGTHFYIGGVNPVHTRKFRNVRDGNHRVAFVVDDLVAVDPWTPRFLRVYGTAELVEHSGLFGSGSYLRITPQISWSWNLDQRSSGDHDQDDEWFRPRRTVHQPSASMAEGDRSS